MPWQLHTLVSKRCYPSCLLPVALDFCFFFNWVTLYSFFVGYQGQVWPVAIGADGLVPVTAQTVRQDEVQHLRYHSSLWLKGNLVKSLSMSWCLSPGCRCVCVCVETERYEWLFLTLPLARLVWNRQETSLKHEAFEPVLLRKSRPADPAPAPGCGALLPATHLAEFSSPAGDGRGSCWSCTEGGGRADRSARRAPGPRGTRRSGRSRRCPPPGAPASASPLPSARPGRPAALLPTAIRARKAGRRGAPGSCKEPAL